jgi:hypothetical protein
MIAESLLGSLLGGVFRLAPEVMKLWDRKNERKHEADMFTLEIQAAEKRLEYGLRQGEQALTGLELTAMSEALKEQGQTARAAGKWVAAISALVRPLVTYWVVALWSAAKVCGMVLAFEQGADWRLVFVNAWGPEDAGILAMILTFWFVGRVFERHGAASSN